MNSTAVDIENGIDYVYNKPDFDKWDVLLLFCLLLVTVGIISVLNLDNILNPKR
jgi:hypothetical protein